MYFVIPNQKVGLTSWVVMYRRSADAWKISRSFPKEKSLFEHNISIVDDIWGCEELYLYDEGEEDDEEEEDMEDEMGKGLGFVKELGEVGQLEEETSWRIKRYVERRRQSLQGDIIDDPSVLSSTAE